MISAAKVQATVASAATMDSTLLDDMIARALAFVESQTRRYFGPVVTLTDYLNGNGSRMLRLPEPVAVLDSEGDVDLVEERSYPGEDPTVIDGDGYDVRHGTNTDYLVRLQNLCWKYGYEYAVTYQRGYAVDAGPKDIEQLLIDLIALRVNLVGHEGMRSETGAGYSYTRFGEGDLDSIDGAWATIRAWRRTVYA